MRFDRRPPRGILAPGSPYDEESGAPQFGLTRTPIGVRGPGPTGIPAIALSAAPAVPGILAPSAPGFTAGFQNQQPVPGILSPQQQASLLGWGSPGYEAPQENRLREVADRLAKQDEEAGVWETARRVIESIAASSLSAQQIDEIIADIKKNLNGMKKESYYLLLASTRTPIR